MNFEVISPFVTLALTGAAALLLVTAGQAASAPSATAQTKLAPCPDTPNCVSTLADDKEHGIAPIPYTGTAAEAKARILQIVNDMPRTKLEVDEGDYLHFTFRSLVFRFVDDVEFVFDDDAKLIHFRSAARLGRSDLGVNRRRMEKIRTRFVQD